MKSMVDPSADFLFESIREISDEHGVSRHVPETDADWEQVRHHATVLLEAPILITMEDRKVAGPGERSANPLVEKDPDEVQRLINTDRPEFLRRARRLQDAATLALNAANAKDSNALFKAIDGINKACESCHLHYWYPDDRRAQEAAKEDGIAP
jgi:DNA-binding transcriptional ArsR family regulator